LLHGSFQSCSKQCKWKFSKLIQSFESQDGNFISVLAAHSQQNAAGTFCVRILHMHRELQGAFIAAFFDKLSCEEM
jgi:hypothetical protein